MAPTIVIVPASFSPAEFYQLFADALRSNGLDTEIVSLPSVGLRRDGDKPGTMLDDAAAVAHVVEDLYNNQDKDEVVLLAHSYGGIPACESMKTISVKNRQGRRGVNRIILLAAIVLPVGVSNDEMRKRPPPDHVKIEDDWITIDHIQDIPYAFNDLSQAEGLDWATKMKQQSTSSFKERATYPGYDDVEIDYIRCTEDQTLPPQGTQRILKVIEDSSGRLPKIHDFPSGHCPNVSKPEKLALLIRQLLFEH